MTVNTGTNEYKVCYISRADELWTLVEQSSTYVRVGQSKNSYCKKVRNIERMSMSRTNYMFQQHRFSLKTT